MIYITVEVDIDHGKVIAKSPEKLPLIGKGLLTILPPASATPSGDRVHFPLIHGDGSRIIDPTREMLDASLWD